ncbi:hypothetical protein E2P84_36660 [Burkholderia cepacia]|uniref:CobQ/CobB/MinD/ParA nucleotide binding domain-containing protein n=1 Tax=Burkholderia cepacia TaxID=292 RepID=A0AAX2RQM6_BURCE|nr:hypothetical protein [Burkholderia cepacia]TES65663.1 hypothetical protein E2P84_36660 [Burkholderia cepacia]TET01681.1 hypothetical protein E3D36_16735 [Burkholderia cepacia]TEU47539.1 hypothetical protein E3D37_16165 [Burkholderia cepacia]TEU53566.1 hypothetical protein E3D38_12555 [Burkholderia cepacia]TEV02172.1 hypothetical protein E3D40_13485 [Burkholderia cepacia]
MCLFLSHGDKGGVGKSFGVRGFADYGVRHGLPLTVVDADNRASDLYHLTRENSAITEVLRLNLRDEQGWMDLSDVIERTGRVGNIAVSLPAAVGDQEDQYGKFLYQVLESLGVPYRVVWVMNDKADSVALLKRFIENSGIPVQNIQPVLNTFFAQDFPVWDGSNTRRMFTEAGIRDVRLPKMEFEDKLTGGNLRGLWSDYLGGKFGPVNLYMRVRLQDWLKQMDEFFDSMNLPLIRNGQSSVATAA